MLCVRRFAGFVLLAGLTACGGDAGRAIGLGAQAQQQLDAGQVYEARQTITAAVKERDDLPALHLLRGRIELSGNRFGPAFDAFAAALSLDATNQEALQGVAQLGLRTGHIRESEDAADRILALQPDQPDALLVKGQLAMVRNRPAETSELADRILTAAPGNEGGAILKARALYMLGDLPGARDFLNKFETPTKNTEGLARTRLELMRQASDAPGMLAEFSVLGGLLPKDFDLRLDEANLRYKTGDVAGARSLLRAVLLDLRPDAAQTARVTALWHEYDRDPLGGAELRILAQSRNEAARIEVARYYFETGRFSVARAVISGARSLEARSLSARVAIASGETTKGAAAAERILANDKTQCDALLARSAAAASARRWSAAVNAAQTAAAECPQSVEASIALARAYEGQRDPGGVRRAFAEGIVRSPQDPKLGRAFGAWLEANGQSRQAIAEARRLTRKAPARLSVWAAYLGVCQRQNDESCSLEAREGLSRARNSFGIDLPSGTLTPRGLFGRLPPR